MITSAVPPTPPTLSAAVLQGSLGAQPAMHPCPCGLSLHGHVSGSAVSDGSPPRLTAHPIIATSSPVQPAHGTQQSGHASSPPEVLRSAALAVVWGAGNSKGTSVPVQPPHGALHKGSGPLLLWLTARSPALCCLCWRLGCRRRQQGHEGGRRAQVPDICGRCFLLGACVPLLHDRLQAYDVP